jgi:hypothetical protein
MASPFVTQTPRPEISGQARNSAFRKRFLMARGIGGRWNVGRGPILGGGASMAGGSCAIRLEIRRL